LPEGWVEKYSKEHNRKFWKNEITGKKSWKQPSTEDNSGGDTPESNHDQHTAEVEETGNRDRNDDEDQWEEKYSEKHGKPYYLNKKTRRKSWFTPSALSDKNGTAKKEDDEGDAKPSTSPLGGDDADWEEKYSEKHGKPYFINKKTRRTSWVLPSPKAVANSPAIEATVNTQQTEEGHNPKAEVESVDNTAQVDKTKESSDEIVTNIDSQQNHLDPVVECEAVSNMKHDNDSEWEEKYSEKHGKAYYLNKKTRCKSWIPPSQGSITHGSGADISKKALHQDTAVTKTAGGQDVSADDHWEEKYSEKHGKPYYLNKKTKRTSWVIPTQEATTHTPDKEEATVMAQQKEEIHIPKSSIDSDGNATPVDKAKKSSEPMLEIVSETAECDSESTSAPKITLPESLSVQSEHDKDSIEFCTTPKVGKEIEEDGKTAQFNKLRSEMQGIFDGDISRIEPQETPESSPIKHHHTADGNATELTVESIKAYNSVEIVATLNYYMKMTAVLEHNLASAQKKCEEVVAQNDAYVTDYALLRQTVHDYASQHHAREEIIHGLEAQVSLLTQERDEVKHTLQQEHSLQANRDVQKIIEDEALLELKVVASSQKDEIASLTSKLKDIQRENEDLMTKNTTLNFLCDEDSNRISTLENKLTQSVRENSCNHEKFQQYKVKCSMLSKKLDATEHELSEIKDLQGGVVDKNKTLINENSKLIKKVAILQKKTTSCRSDIIPIKKLPSPSNRFSSEGIHIPVSMIQSCDATRYLPPQIENGESLMDYSLSDINIMDVDKDERYKRRMELEAGWVFVDVDHIPLRKLIENAENETENIADDMDIIEESTVTEQTP